MKHKHLTLENRQEIEIGLLEGASFRCIAASLEKSPSTISREIRKNAVRRKEKVYAKVPNSCKHRYHCKVYDLCSPCRYKKPKEFCRFCRHCNDHCSHYEEEICPLLDEAPYVCNGCKKRKTCTLIHTIYEAKQAHSSYTRSWKEDREGFYLTGLEMQRIDELVSPRLKQGQSLYAILCDVSDQLPCGQSSLYRLINDCELGARNADLPRKMRFRGPKRKRPHKVDRSCHKGRSYEDFTRFLLSHSAPFTVEMDTVEGKKGGPVLLSLEWKENSLIRFHKREYNDARSVKEIFDDYEKRLGLDIFKKLFPVLLTDRGSEFTDPSALEFSPFTGERRSYVFYCDPQRADQKGAIENCHSLARRMIPKSEDLGCWTQEVIDEVGDHLNSYPRKKLMDKSPYDSFSFFLGDDIPNLLNWERIPPKDIQLNPHYFRNKLK